MQKVFVGLNESRRLALGVLLVCAVALSAGPAAAAPPADDNFAAATVMSYHDGRDTAEATLELNEPQPTGCVANGGSVGRTVWKKFVAPAGTGWERLELYDASMVGMPGHELDDAVWTVWTGSSLSTLTQVACDDNSGADRWPNLIFPVTPGQTYYLQIGGVRAASAPDAWGGPQDLILDSAAGPPAVTLDGPGNETGSPVDYVQPGTTQHWDIYTSGQATTTGQTTPTVSCTYDGFARPCSVAAGLDVTPSSGEHTIVAKLVHFEDVWATTTKRFTAGAPPTTTTTTPSNSAPVVTPAPSLVAPTLTLGKLGLATIARKRAIAVRCVVNQPGRCRVTVTIAGKTAKRLRLTRSARKPYRLAAGSTAFSAAGTKTLMLAIAKSAAKRIRRARSLKLQFTITGEYPTATRSARRSLTVRR
jgi:hypothetical protein